MDDDVQSMIGVADLVCTPLYESIFRPDFCRGPCAADGTSFFVGEDVSSPVQLSVIGEVKATCINDNGLLLMLGRPEMCSKTMALYWRQEISALERIELHDDFVDHRLGACPRIKRWIHHLNGTDDRMLIYMFIHYTSVNIIDKFLQPVDVLMADVSGDIAVGDLVHCRVVLGSQQQRLTEGVLGCFQHYFIFALSVDRLQDSVPDSLPLDHWRHLLFE
ncbi:hypothetical protein L208DRAFT_1242413 [Tricholoma matsutake]|nr:hypothetical protein L208DRAFT_1242413 [Tricholoma matsutake 945]